MTNTPTLLMRDSVTASSIPEDTPVVAGYTNGDYKWSDEDWARFPDQEKASKLVRICIFIPGRLTPMSADDHVLDVEAGDVLKPEGQRALDEWTQFQKTLGKVPTIYTSRSFLPYVARDGCDYWLADYPWPGEPVTPHLIPGTVATQYVNGDTMGVGYDASLALESWPKGRGGDQMPTASCVGVQLTKTGKGYWMFGRDGGVFAYGDAKFCGSLGGTALNSPIVGFSVMPDDDGYVMCGGDFGLFHFGSAEALRSIDPGHP